MSKFFFKEFLCNKYFIEFLENLILILVILTSGNFLFISIIFISGIYLAGAITTGNPAVVLALFLAEKISTSELFFFILAEILGCVFGVLIYNQLLRKN